MDREQMYAEIVRILEENSGSVFIDDTLLVLVCGKPYWSKAFTADELRDLIHQNGEDSIKQVYRLDNFVWKLPKPVTADELQEAYNLLTQQQQTIV